MTSYQNSDWKPKLSTRPLCFWNVRGFFFQIPLSLQCTEAPTAHQGQSALPHGAEETPCAPGGKAFQSLTDKGTCIQNSSISCPPNQPPSFEKKFGNKTSQSHLILHQKIWVCRLSRNSVSLRTASSTAPVCSPDVGRDLGKDDIDGRFAAGQGRVHALRGARQRLLRHLRDLESYRKIIKPTITQLNTGKNRRDTWSKALLTKHFFELLNLGLRDPGDRNPLVGVVICWIEKEEKISLRMAGIRWAVSSTYISAHLSSE